MEFCFEKLSTIDSMSLQLLGSRELEYLICLPTLYCCVSSRTIGGYLSRRRHKQYVNQIGCWDSFLGPSLLGFVIF